MMAEVESLCGPLASILTCTSTKEAGICPFPNTCGSLHMDCPLKQGPGVGKSPAFLVFSLLLSQHRKASPF